MKQQRLRVSMHQLVRLSGLPQRRVEDLTRDGALVPPEQKVTCGGRQRPRRVARWYDIRGAFAACLAASLLRAGVRNGPLVKAVAWVQRTPVAEANRWRFLCVSGEKVWAANEAATFTTDDPRGAVLIAVDLKAASAAFAVQLVAWLKRSGLSAQDVGLAIGQEDEEGAHEAGQAGERTTASPVQPAPVE